ncbi:unnamed protein product [Aphanomyces euteiches]|uniref:Uncharacterized protein n=1 Tax=Aphanomyces euteiches TaxID=100861 RepID=A0A6G0WHW8_9STRA|nr:hypothetical protein Ae201684_015042 [Aphanomyces euteiches]KAH9062921.1 hypothetical protein Ae201684P_009187 [Aphanomyces euteiches]KAH9154816.1 hypothetical protein AeRB84_003139 [Aphanomyces euteiches]
MSGPVEEIQLIPAPSDSISCVRFSPDTSDLLLVSSWDNTLSLYDVPSNRLRLKAEVGNPLLSCTFGPDRTRAFSGGLHGAVAQYDLEQNSTNPNVLGSHEKGVAHVRYSQSTNQVFSGSWDGNVSGWDPKANTKAPTMQLKQSGKVYAMSFHEHLLVVGTSTKQIALYDIRRGGDPIREMESPLKYQIRCIKLFPDGQGFVIGSTEGRVALEYVDPDRKGYSFRCHREKISETETYVFPINAVAFHRQFGTFATGGCDGIINVWDGENKKRINQFVKDQATKYPTSIASMDFNHDGTRLAIASSYTFEEGEKDHPEDAIFVRTIHEADVRPKKKAAA